MAHIRASLALAGALVCTAVAAKAQVGWQPSVMSVRVSPGESQLRPGQRLNLVVSAFDASGATITAQIGTGPGARSGRAQDMSNGDLPFVRVVYTSGDVHIATVSDEGLISGVSPGQVTITARVGNGPGARSATASIEVLPAP
jgi:hypothetical protein